MLSRIGKRVRRFRQRFSRSEWATRHLHPGRLDDRNYGVHSPGVLILQIDGLGHEQFLKAIERRKLPFLQQLIQRDHFVLRPFYSGLPSTTPAVQAELFYGVKSAVPAFQYFRRKTEEVQTMYEADAADRLAARLGRKASGLLQGGSSYANIFAGGADEAPFCIQSMKLESLFHGIQLRKLAWFTLVNLEKVFRIAGLALLEAGLALIDCCKGVLERRNPLRELKFIFSRIGACIVLRELIRVRVKIDIARGQRIIHANFIGYDEHSHRRSPDSAFAFWTLAGIDATLRSLVKKAVRSDKRDYQVFIYSDHGQEASLAFSDLTGKTLRQAVGEAFSAGPLCTCRYGPAEKTIPHLNLHRRSTGLLRRSVPQARPARNPAHPENGRIHITAMGPLGHIYLPLKLDEEQMAGYARRLVEVGGVPLVFHRRGDTVLCTSTSARGELEDLAAEVFGADHPFLEEVTSDMARLCRHEDAGDFVISGWRKTAKPLTFVPENGSHGGPGASETKGFVIVPDTLAGEHRFFRPLLLRRTIRDLLAARPPAGSGASAAVAEPTRVLKVMSYNVHSCIGLDGKLFPERIARIIGRHSPDAVALQEVDRNMERTGRQDQLRLIADKLDLHSCFFPVLARSGEEYGLAVLSRYPIQLRAQATLPGFQGRRKTERRGLLWVELATPNGPLHLFNTHLSLNRRERLLQMEHIVGADLLGSLPPTEPVIFCGDFNASPASPPYMLLSKHLSDCQRIHSSLPPEPTFFSAYPLLRLDHIFHSNRLTPLQIAVIEDWECRLASDHLPLSATLLYASGVAN